MSLVVDDSAPQWIYSSAENATMSWHAAGWHQLANDPLADPTGYFNGTALWTNATDTSATLVFQGTGILLYAAKIPQGGRMNVTCDWESKTVDLQSDSRQQSSVVWQLSDLDSTTMHAVRIQKVDGGRINFDGVQIIPGPPSAFPPVMPDPLPPAFPNLTRSVLISTMTSTMTMTRTMETTMTATVSPRPDSSDVSLSRGAAAGIAIGLIAVSCMTVFLFLRCRRRQHRGSTSNGRNSGLRGLRLPQWIGWDDYDRTRSGSPSFMNEDGGKTGKMEERSGDSASRASSRLLPSIRPPSTMTLGNTSVSTPSHSILARFPPPPSRPSYSPSRTHRRDRSALSIDTNIDPVVKSLFVGNFKKVNTGSVSDSRAVQPVLAQRPTSDEFSSSDLTEEWYEIDHNHDVRSVHDEMDAAVYYSEHFASRSDQEHPEEQDIKDYAKEPDDISPSTPLLAQSPAIASSNASLSHHASALSHVSNLSKGNKILRSLHSHSSRRSSMRKSFGRPSRHSSAARTPVSKNSTSTTASGSPRSERHRVRRSTLSMSSIPVLAAGESCSPSGIIFPVPVPEVASPSSPIHPPSSWNSVPLRSIVAKQPRVHRPFGPRPRSVSNASIKTNSSSDGTAHGRNLSQAEIGDMLSVVEEGSRPESSRTSF